MKTQIICCALAASIHLALGPSPCSGQPALLVKSPLTLDVRADCSSCLPGEPVRLEIRTRNTSPSPVGLPAGADVWEGHVWVLIAFEDGPFKEYRGPGWGLRDVAGGEPIVLEPGGAFTTEATILFNEGVRTSHLGAAYAATMSARHLAEGYALGRPGRYRIKAALHDQTFGDRVESSVAEVRVAEPEGADADVWTVLRANPELGYLIQSASPRGRSSSEASERLVDLAERLAFDNPSSRYADGLRESVSKSREMLDRLRARGLPIR